VCCIPGTVSMFSINARGSCFPSPLIYIITTYSCNYEMKHMSEQADVALVL
jgi:hypothetical protein